MTMSAVDFDPMAYVENDTAPPAKLAKVAKDTETFAAFAAFANPLPPEIVDGLGSLQTMRAPRWAGTDRWRVFVSDALWLADSGVAADALGRGWTATDLWGASADDEWQSLAAWINGRRDEHGRACLLLTEIRGERSMPYAVHVSDGRHAWHYLQPAPADARPVWTI